VLRVRHPPYFDKSGTHLFLYIKEKITLCKSAKKNKMWNIIIAIIILKIIEDE